MTRHLRTGLALALALLAGAACIDPFLGPEPDGDSALENFDLMWESFDRHYSFFQLKGIDWEAMREKYRPLVPPTNSDLALLRVVTDMLDELEDGHVNVFTARGTYAYIGWYSDAPRSFVPELIQPELADPLVGVSGGPMAYARAAPGIGYVWLPTFREGMGLELETALEAMAPLDGLIIDLRQNGGGSDTEVRELAGRLVENRALYRTVRVRNGPEHDDFTPPTPSYVEPLGTVRFTGPVVLLTNRRTFSSAESFVLAMRTRTGVTVVGDTTGGGSGNPIYRELPNGWIYRMSRWISYDARGVPFEGVGLAPDRYITFDVGAQRDSILVEGLRVLRETTGG